MNESTRLDAPVSSTLVSWLYPAAALLALTGVLNSASALVLGAALALGFDNPYLEHAKRWIHPLLSLSVIGLGMGMNLRTVAKVGFHGFGYTAASIAFVFAAGYVLRRVFKVESQTALLITAGTAICGGSAIAAVAAVIRAKHHEVTVSLATVFLLNAVALVLFPAIGTHFGLSQTQFGLWGALAIHDTSSVVGAAMQYGRQALEVGTTVKLARALWIVPLTLALGFQFRQEAGAERVQAKRPWFILGFLLAAALVTFLPGTKAAGALVGEGAQRLLVLTLFLIGSSLTWKSLKAVGMRPLLMGVTLWVLVSITALSAILANWIR